MKVAGLTGNFGMGKSTVRRLFEELGAHAVDADQVVGELLLEPEVIDRISAIVEKDVRAPGGGIDRRAVSGVIFSEPEKREAVQRFIHPLVFDRIEIMLKNCSGPIAIVEAPLIFEGGHEGRFDTIITVRSTYENAINRLLDKGVPEQESKRRLAAQMPISQKAARSGYVIINDGSLKELKTKVVEIYKELTEK